VNTAERIDRTKCNACGACADVCPALALKRMGVYYAPHLLVEELLRDRIFYETSRGGVTFSGGEPTLHMDYLSAVTKLLKQNGVHIAVQTAGHFDLNEFADKLLPRLDIIFYDIKFLDSGEHKKWTGKDNKIILANFLELTRQNKDLIMPRIPLVPGITATKDNLVQIAGFIRAAGYDRYELLAYNSACASKRLPLGKSVLEAVKLLRWEEKAQEQYRGIFVGCFLDGWHQEQKLAGRITC
jgi:pyruvate formate lyase activating enzyme